MHENKQQETTANTGLAYGPEKHMHEIAAVGLSRPYNAA